MLAGEPFKDILVQPSITEEVSQAVAGLHEFHLLI